MIKRFCSVLFIACFVLAPLSLSAIESLSMQAKRPEDPTGKEFAGANARDKDQAKCERNAANNALTAARKKCEDYCKPAAILNFGCDPATPTGTTGPDGNDFYTCGAKAKVTKCECGPREDDPSPEEPVDLDDPIIVYE